MATILNGRIIHPPEIFPYEAAEEVDHPELEFLLV